MEVIFLNLKKYCHFKMNMETHDYNSSTWEAVVGEL